MSQPNGHFTISAPGGNYVISIINIPSMKGVDFTEPVEISNNRITSRTYAVSGPVPQGQLRIVLTWGATPRDMDSHLDTPSGCHVYYGQKQCKSGEAGLDTDVTDSYGPETINIRKLKPGVYRYKVHAYSSGAIEESEASVTLYGVSRHPVTFDIGRDGQVRRGAVHDLVPRDVTLSRAGAGRRLACVQPHRRQARARHRFGRHKMSTRPFFRSCCFAPPHS